MKQVVPLVEGDSCGWEGFCAHHAVDTAAAEPRSLLRGKRVAEQSHQPCSASCLGMMSTAGAITPGQDKPVTCGQDQLLLINGLKEAGKCLPSRRAVWLQLPESQA